jgi:cobalt-zinc-cadmium efflux system outer membrane protein
MYHSIIIFTCIFLYSVFCPLFSQGAEQISEGKSLTMMEAESLFMKNNLLLLAAKFQIETKRALIIQARLYANPNIFLEQNTFNDKTDRILDFTRNGQTVVQIQQLFLLGGKIDKRIRVAEINTKISEERFSDILRALKLELRSNFLSIYFLREALKFYDKSTESLRKTVDYSERAYLNRTLLLSEVLRIKALLFFLEQERTEILVQIKEKESSLRVLLNEDSIYGKNIIPVIDEKKLDTINPEIYKSNEVLELAIEYRPDLKAAIQSVKYEEANLALQKANAIPDLSFGPVYNRAGTYIPNYFGFTAQLNVPIFDRNQGNIEAAEKAILERRSGLQNQRITVENEVIIELTRAVEKNKIYNQFKGKFTEDYGNLATLMISNYQKRYLTIIEFADFFETYRNTIVNILKLKTERAESFERLNYVTGKSIIVIQPEVE